MVEFSRTEYRTSPAPLVQDRDTQRVCRLCDFITTQLIPPDQAHRMAGKVDSVDIRRYTPPGDRIGPPDASHARSSNAPDGTST